MEGREDPQYFSMCKIFEGDLYNHLNIVNFNLSEQGISLSTRKTLQMKN